MDRLEDAEHLASARMSDYRHMRGGKANYSYDLRVWSHNSARPDCSGPSVGVRCVRAAVE